MKRYIARHGLTAQLGALALLALCFVQTPLTAAGPMPQPMSDHRDGPLHLGHIGFVSGQTMRVSAAHVSTDSRQDQPPPVVRVGVWLFDAQGRVIAQSVEVQIPRNEFRSFDFDRAALNLPGEQGTGRLQVGARLVMHVAEPYHLTDDPNAMSFLVPSLELIENSTGRTTATVNNLKQIGLAWHNFEGR